MSCRRTLLHVFPTFAVGGSQMRFAALANRFGGIFRHLIVAMDGRTDCNARLRDDLEVEYLEPQLRPRDTTTNVVRFRGLLRTAKPDLLVTYNWGSIEAAMANWFVHVPHVHVEDGFGPDEANGQLRRRVLARRYVLARSTVVLPSRVLYRLASDVWKLKRLRYVPNGIDLDRFGAGRQRPFVWPGSGPVIGTVAALRPEKNIARLLDAFRQVRSQFRCRLVIAGDGTDRIRLEHKASMLGISDDVIFAGHVDETERLYRSLSLFAMSSDTEQMPTAVLEAMAAGLPVAATNVGDVADMVARENRPFITALDSGELAEAMTKLLSVPEQACAVGAANRSKAEECYGQEKMFAAYGAIFGV